MQPSGGGAGLLAQEDLDVGVDVLKLGAPLDFAGAEAFEDAAEPGDDRRRLVRGDDARCAEHARVRDRTGDVVFVQVPVDAGGVVAREVIH